MTAPNPEQQAVVEAPLEAGVVIAGAGSGKTTTMVGRVLHLVQERLVRPEQVLGLTFTTKAAGELASRVRIALGARDDPNDDPDGDPDGQPTVSTYHAYAGRIVRDHALRLGREPGSRLITPATSWQLASRVVGAYDGPMTAIDWTEPTVVKAVLALAGDLSEHLVDATDVRGVGEWLERAAEQAAPLTSDGKKVRGCHDVREQLLPLVLRYQQAKLERDLLDFGDVVTLAARLARECAAVREAERASYAVVLLDEYQDTGAAQEALLSALFGDGHAVTAVGDPSQSIYGWRGAGAGTLTRFPQAFGAAGPARQLSTNYRSGGRLLRLANAVSVPLRAQGVPVRELAARPGAEDSGVVRCALLESVEQEAHWVADEVVAALDGRPWSAAAVLCRRRAMFPLLREAFEGRGVPVEVVGLGGLLDVPEVADVVATLRVLDDPTADAALLRLLTGPRWRIGPRDLVVLGRRARSLVAAARPESGDPVEAVVLGAQEEAGSLVDALDDLPPAGLSPDGGARLAALRDELRSLRRRLDQPLADLVADVERTLGLDVEVSALGLGRADLDAFADQAASFSGDVARDGAGEAVLSAFLAFLAAADEEEHGLDAGTATAQESVKLMTVHAAKGLEWPVVAVPGLSAGTASSVFPARGKASTSWTANARLLPFPLRGDAAELPRLAGLSKDEVEAHRAANKERDALDERRLAYVALTRAQEVLLTSGYHWGEGKKVLGPSPYLLEVRLACEDGAGEVVTWCAEPPELNPVSSAGRSHSWPSEAPPAGPRVLEAARLVCEAGTDDDVLDGEDAALVARWDDDLARLADEADRRRASVSEVQLPGHLSVSALVELRRDPSAFAASLLRPLPQRPSPAARRGTAFHAWLEREVFGAPQLLDPEELPGSADPEGVAADLTTLQDAFRASAWWGRTPVEVEVPFEMEVDGVLVRGRMDAVYRDEDGGSTVVDWKTGAVPTGADTDAAAVQLATYRLAWARLSAVPVEQVRAVFHYVAAGVTVEPPDVVLDHLLGAQAG